MVPGDRALARQRTAANRVTAAGMDRATTVAMERMTAEHRATAAAMERMTAEHRATAAAMERMTTEDRATAVAMERMKDLE